MDYFIKPNHKQRLIEVLCEGHICMDLYKSVAEEIAVPSNWFQYPVIVDLRRTTLHFDTEELYNAPKNLEGWEPDTFICHGRVALVIPKKNYRRWKFIELVNDGLGRNLKVFINGKEAEDWATSRIDAPYDE